MDCLIAAAAAPVAANAFIVVERREQRTVASCSADPRFATTTITAVTYAVYRRPYRMRKGDRVAKEPPEAVLLRAYAELA